MFALRLQLAADGYRVVTSDDLAGLNGESSAISTFMYKQRFFAGCLPNLVQGFHAADPAVKANYVLALSHVLGAVPKQVLLAEVDAVWPLLVESLARPEEGLSSSTLSLMRTLIEEAKDMMAGHAKSLIDALIPLCIYRVSPPPPAHPMSTHACTICDDLRRCGGSSFRFIRPDFGQMLTLPLR